MAAPGVVVWEWKNEFGGWRPYDPKISTFIEMHKGSFTPLQLGSIDPKLNLYEVDLQNMCQIRQGTGTQRHVRRTVHPSTSPIAKGITWQWVADAMGNWSDFEPEITELLEDCFTKNQTLVDLSKSRFCLPYHIDLHRMTQKRIETGRIRNIQRVFSSSSYPLDLSSNNGNKRRSACVNKNASVKKSKTATSSNTGLGFLPQSTATSSFSASSTGLGFLPPVTNPSMTPATPRVNYAGFPPTGATSLPPSNTVIQFGSSQGPITRSRFSQYNTFPALSQSSQPSTQTASTTLQSNFSHNSPALQAASGPFIGFGNVGSAPLNFQPNIFHGQTPAPSSNIPHGGLLGGNMQSGSWYGFLPAAISNAVHQPAPFQSGNLNLFPGSRSSRIKPSVPSGSSASASALPKYDRISNMTHKSGRQSGKHVISAEDILQSFVSVMNTPPADEDCCICVEKLIEASGHGTGTPEDGLVLQLEKCSHMFHKLCLNAMYDSGSRDGSLQCPSCKTIYGEKMGNCPKGEMEYRVINSELPGYEGCQTIQILYHIHSGIQGPEHPNPGKRFSTRGFPRIGYVPDCDKGRKALQLLIVAWKRRLIFTIGSSTTTGEENTVTWNEIHHKTELGSNYSGHGFPDPKYLDNVLSELAVHGITEKDLTVS